MPSIGEMMQKPVHRAVRGTNLLVDDQAKVGIEIEVRGWGGRDSTAVKFARYWEGKEDHSLKSTGREYVTRGGLVGEDIVNAIDAFYDVASKSKLNNGYPYAGIHLHVDSTEMEVENGQLSRFVEAYMLAEPLLFHFAGEYRRNCGFCYSLEQAQADYPLIGKGIYSGSYKSLQNTLARRHFSKYQALNLQPLATFGTIEFRHLPTTMEKQRLLDWVNIVLSLRVAAMTRDSIAEAALRDRPLTFLQGMFSPNLWEQLVDGFDPARYWGAIDNIFALRQHASSAEKPYLQEEGNSNFERSAVNQLLQDKMRSLPKKKAKTKTPSREVPRRLTEDDIAGVTGPANLNRFYHENSEAVDAFVRAGSDILFAIRYLYRQQLIAEQAAMNAGPF